MHSALLAPYAEFCEWTDATLLIFSENVFDPLIYYSHIVPVLIALPFSLLVFAHQPRHRLAQLLLALTVFFSAWSFFDLMLWAQADPPIIMFVWSLLILLEPLIYYVAFFFAHYAMFASRPPMWCVAVLSIGMLPIIIFLPTTLAIESFDLTNCYREVHEGPLVFYGYLYQIFVILIILGFAAHALTRRGGRMRTALFALGTVGFLLTFSSGNIIGSIAEDWTLGQYGIFGMPVLVGFLAVLIARYHAFNTKIVTAEMLIGMLGVLTIGLAFVQTVETVRIVSVATFVLVALIGMVLVRSIRVEIRQREEIERLAEQLKKANARLKVLDQMKSEFVSIASHQLRSPLTSVRGYASMLLEGSFGKLPQKAREAVERIAESSKFMATSVEDYLNVSRIQTGNMKYEYSEFPLKEIAMSIADDMRPIGMKRGLLITFRSNAASDTIVKADIGKTRQIVQNLVDNSIKYTKAGSVAVSVRDAKRPKRVYVDVTDTGIGMSKETLENIFGKFERARNANEVNVTGTGLGLYVAKKMAEDMGGTVTAHSEGEGKGSTFTLELPLVR